MSTHIYSSPIFGPVISRRLGVSLGINLMPADGKICTFDCIYCECGLNAERRPALPRPTRQEVRDGLQRQLEKMSAEGPKPDVLTFAGNGEPTAHPDFPGIVDDVIMLRDKYFPNAKVSVLSNATRVTAPKVFDALMRIDNNIQKLDTVDMEYIRKLDRPVGKYDLEAIIDSLRKFNGHVIIQTMFLSGEVNGVDYDNTSDRYVIPWMNAIQSIRPEKVMIYTIDRETPVSGLRKATPQILDKIAERLRMSGVDTGVSY